MTSLTIQEYSPKSFVVLGDTEPHKEQLKGLGGRWNANLKCGKAWIFSNKQLDRIKKYIEKPLESCNIHWHNTYYGIEQSDTTLEIIKLKHTLSEARCDIDTHEADAKYWKQKAEEHMAVLKKFTISAEKKVKQLQDYNIGLLRENEEFIEEVYCLKEELLRSGQRERRLYKPNEEEDDGILLLTCISCEKQCKDVDADTELCNECSNDMSSQEAEVITEDLKDNIKNFLKQYC